MSSIKRFLIFIVAAVYIILCSGVLSLAVDLDGVCGNAEWRESTVFVLKEQKIFNNEIKSAVVKTLDGDRYGCVYLAVFEEFEKNGDMGSGEIRIRINDGSDIFINIDKGVTDSGGYDVEAVSTYDELSYCAVTEIAIYSKDSVKSTDEFKINLFDLNGNESNTFTVNFVTESDNTEADEPSEITEKSTKTSKSKSSRTTKVKTTRLKTASAKRYATTKPFNYKKVDKNKTTDIYEDEEIYEIYDEEAPQTITAESRKSPQKMKYAYVAAGTVCAMGVAVAAVICAMKSADSKDKKDK